METSSTLTEIAKALSKAQGEFTGAEKSATNPHFKKNYADFASVKEACQTGLTNNGLSIIQSPSGGPDDLSMTTMLLHTSGEWIKDVFTMPVAQKTPQGFGSAITYARRYSLMSILGIAPEEDDDGNEASKPQQPKTNNQPQRPRAVPNLSPETIFWYDKIGKLIDDGLINKQMILSVGLGTAGEAKDNNDAQKLEDMYGRLLVVVDEQRSESVSA